MTVHQHSPLACDCKSGVRTLVLLDSDNKFDFAEFAAFGAGEHWHHEIDYGIVCIEVGPGKRWAGAGEVVNFLRSVVTDPLRLEDLQAAWLDRRLPLAAQLVRLGREAEPLHSFTEAENGASQLLDILHHRRIETWYQPVIEARTNRIWGYECLMRGSARDGVLIGAPQLLEWAGNENLKFMLDRVCRETHLENAGRLNLGTEVKFLINFLPTAIYQPEYCLQTSLAAMRRSGLRAEQVIFEVVESERVEDCAHLLRILDFYRRSGFGVALDDMGSGYAGLNLLGDLQPDLIKIDRAIINKAVHSKTHFNICAALTKLGHDNQQLVLAEGVETEEEVRLVSSLGVDLFQGYYFGKPQPEPEKTVRGVPSEVQLAFVENSTFVH